MKATLSIYRWPTGVLRVCPMRRTTSGFYVSSGPVRDASEGDAESLGMAILAALADARFVVPDPSPDASRLGMRAFLKAIGVKTHRQLIEETTVVNAIQDGDAFIAIPTSNRGPREGYVHHPEQQVTTRNLSPKELGQAVLAALARSNGPGQTGRV